VLPLAVRRVKDSAPAVMSMLMVKRADPAAKVASEAATTCSNGSGAGVVAGAAAVVGAGAGAPAPVCAAPHAAASAIARSAVPAPIHRALAILIPPSVDCNVVTRSTGGLG
jgi:hypothetical protein